MEFLQLFISMGLDNIPPGSRHQVDWEAAKTIEVEGNYWRRRVLEALHIHQQQHTSNLDCGLAINPSWLPVLSQPSPP